MYIVITFINFPSGTGSVYLSKPTFWTIIKYFYNRYARLKISVWVRFNSIKSRKVTHRISKICFKCIIHIIKMDATTM